MANAIYGQIGTPIVFKDSGGDAVLTLQNLGFGVGRISARYDRGAGSKPQWYQVTSDIQYATAPQLGEFAEVYLSQSDGTLADGSIGTADAALTADKLRNLKLISVNEVDTTSTNTDIVSSGVVFISSRYISTGAWNRSSGDNFRNTANTSQIILTPIPPEIQ